MKKILNIIFGITIILTIVGIVSIVLNEPGDDIWYNSWDFVVILFFLIPLLIVELGIYYNCIYFFTEKNKKRWKTIFNILICIISCTMLISIYGCVVWMDRIWETLFLVLCTASILLWIVYVLLCKW